jgi:hypothetical protein
MTQQSITVHFLYDAFEVEEGTSAYMELVTDEIMQLVLPEPVLCPPSSIKCYCYPSI